LPASEGYQRLQPGKVLERDFEVAPSTAQSLVREVLLALEPTGPKAVHEKGNFNLEVE
jgi:hypothetical protein